MPCLLEKKENKREICFFFSWVLIKFNGNTAQNKIEFRLDFKPALQFPSLIVLAKCLYAICALENNFK